ncbi:unnamed protein product [Effrenium voratum]|uniref:P-type ATPase A domain-containing protein n=1 Tax=Effrenium voratum TaxID=2562239 RepID=A0AA36IM10_9DINO|nr:unnamed protein product [Effrenium voratum]
MSRVSRALRSVMQLETIRMVSLAKEGKLIPASELKAGDVIALRPGEECPADGKVTRGSASCSEAAITGEAKPVEKKKEHEIASGCVILNGYVEVQEAQMQRTGKQLMLERPSITAAGLDKTGTLTKGEFAVLVVQDFAPKSADSGRVDPLTLAAALEMKSAHPISAAIVSKAVGCVGEAYELAQLPEVKKFRVLPGVGIQGNVSSGTSFAQVLVGNKRVLEAVQADPSAHSKFSNFQQQHPDDTTVAVVVNGTLRLGLALNDMIRGDAELMVRELKALGCQPAMLTGDAEAAGKHVALSVGLNPASCSFSMHPEEKQAWIQQQEDSGKSVLMLGDGINDATALAVASVGVAMGETSAALAANSADMVMMTDKLGRLCRYAIWIERANIFIPCLVKIVEVGFALSGHLKLWMAIVADLGTLLLVLMLGISILSRRFWTSEKPSAYAEALLNHHHAHFSPSMECHQLLSRSCFMSGRHTHRLYLVW